MWCLYPLYTGNFMNSQIIMVLFTTLPSTWPIVRHIVDVIDTARFIIAENFLGRKSQQISRWKKILGLFRHLLFPNVIVSFGHKRHSLSHSSWVIIFVVTAQRLTPTQISDTYRLEKEYLLNKNFVWVISEVYSSVTMLWHFLLEN